MLSLQNAEVKHVCSLYPTYTFGWMGALAHASHHSPRQKKWQVFLEKEMLLGLDRLGVSLGDTGAQLKSKIKLGSWKVETTLAMRKWGTAPEFGTKISYNWV
jgi:hypothetical protein